FGGRRINGASVEVTCEPDEKMAILAAIHERPGEIADIEVIPPSLDEVYRHYSACDPEKEVRP
ncbi:ABC transporter ATP-binding protein, partial [Tepidamorphus sp. 3E244]